MSVRSGNAAAGVPGRRPRGRLWSVVLLVMALAGCQSFGSASDSGSDDDASSFARYTAFIRANPRWPSLNLFRRRAEARLSCFPSSPTSIATRLAC